MTKLLSLSIMIAFAVGCGPAKKNETTNVNKDQTTDNTTQGSGSDATQTAGDGTPCAQEVALECPDGQIDGCLKTPAEGDTHKCVAQ
jgi:hypothetical protein